MYIHSNLPGLFVLAAAFTSAFAQISGADSGGIFQPNWTSIGSQYHLPDWYRDAKFGIFIHWGVYSVPAYHDEWYPRWMYQSGEKVRGQAFDYHIKTYGPQDKFGYKDFIPMFKAEKFDAAAWAKLFKASGARYVIPVAEHHDGFSMYDSAINPWNAVRMGPKRDVIGELSKAIRAEGLHFGVSSHRAEHWWFFSGGRDFASDVTDPAFAGLYGPAMQTNPRYQMDSLAGQAFKDDWLNRCKELVDKYNPDLFYFDLVGNWGPAWGQTLPDFVAYYYNKASRPVAVNFKEPLMPDNTGVYDIERGVSESARPLLWQTDTSVGKKSWSHTADEEFKSPTQLICEFCDVVAKNGVYLLNIGPRADGTIPEEPTRILNEFGQWLKVNGEGIYGTRPAAIAGEGPTRRPKTGPGADRVDVVYTASDFRFTRKEETLYAIALNWPADGHWVIHSLASGDTSLIETPIQSVSLLGSAKPVVWSQTAEGLKVTVDAKPCDHVYVLQISAKGLKPFVAPTTNTSPKE